MNEARRTQNGERQRSSLLFLLVWIVLIVVIVVPWHDWQDHPHWMNVAWRPFVDRPWRVLDAILNVALYLPLGWSVRRLGRRAWPAVFVGAILSVATESAQLYSHSRVPSLTDVTCNVVGAWAGSLLAGAIHRTSETAGVSRPGTG